MAQTNKTMQVTLYTKPNCHLCDELKIDLRSLQQEIGFDLVECNIEEQEDDYKRFRYWIPVLETEGGILLYPPHDLVTIRQILLPDEPGQLQGTVG